jgi:hypothetical protein
MTQSPTQNIPIAEQQNKQPEIKVVMTETEKKSVTEKAEVQNGSSVK